MRKEGQEGRRDGESEKMKKLLKDASMASLGLVAGNECHRWLYRLRGPHLNVSGRSGP